MKKIFQRKAAKSQRRKEGKNSLRLCSAIYENSAFCAKYSTLCFLCLLLFMLFGCGLPRCAFAPLRLAIACPSALRSSRKCAIPTDCSPKREFFFVFFAFFVVKELSMRWRMSDFFTSDNGGASRFRVGVFSLFDPVSTLPNQYAFPCPRKAVFVRVLRLFAANQL